MHLRVWWEEEEGEGFFGDKNVRTVKMTGIVLGVDRNYELSVWTDDGKLKSLREEDIKRFEWVKDPRP